MKKTRIDRLLLERGLVESRQKAQSLIMAGNVLVNENPVTKAGTFVDPELPVRIRETDRFVSRGGIKLNGALDALGIPMQNRIVLDIGASTGGFTDCCLQRGATQVYAVDVGTNQLAWRMRQDPRVQSLEQTNARYLEPERFNPRPDIAVIDVSFISVTRILESVFRCLTGSADILAMIKPQFEVGRDRVGKGGVVRNREDRMTAVENAITFAAGLGLICGGTSESVLAGPRGNLEIFVWLKPENRNGDPC